jgi:hypothetical protein
MTRDELVAATAIAGELRRRALVGCPGDETCPMAAASLPEWCAPCLMATAADTILR